VRFLTCVSQLNGAAADAFSLNFGSQASSTTAGPKPLYSAGADDNYPPHRPHLTSFTMGPCK
jgi:hypothetical protein